LKGELLIKREDRFGGNLLINNTKDLKDIYTNGELHPMDLKNTIADILIEVLKPAREKFNNSESQQLIKRISFN